MECLNCLKEFESESATHLVCSQPCCDIIEKKLWYWHKWPTDRDKEGNYRSSWVTRYSAPCYGGINVCGENEESEDVVPVIIVPIDEYREMRKKANKYE
jgi:hypothetical protein